VVDVGDTTHSDERDVVQEPADDGVETGVVDLVYLVGLEVVVTALPTDEVEGNQEREDTQGGRGTPVDDGVAEEEVLDDCNELDNSRQTTRINLLSSFQPHIRRPTCRKGHCQNLEARSSCLSGSGTSALLEVIMATLRWMKS
jgi:hypothetical protein